MTPNRSESVDTDIVERLRVYAGMADASATEHQIPAFAQKAKALREAADEIERLRAILRDMLKPIGPKDEDDIERFIADGEEAIKRARAALGEDK
jgi:hypothetical protein